MYHNNKKFTLLDITGTKPYRAEESFNENHFMYFRSSLKRRMTDWTPPTKETTVSFSDWLKLAVSSQNVSLMDIKHQYFRVDSDAVRYCSTS